MLGLNFSCSYMHFAGSRSPCILKIDLRSGPVQNQKTIHLSIIWLTDVKNDSNLGISISFLECYPLFAPEPK